jgi:hypothetical protein
MPQSPAKPSCMVSSNTSDAIQQSCSRPGPPKDAWQFKQSKKCIELTLALTLPPLLLTILPFAHPRFTTRSSSLGERVPARLCLDAVVRRPYLIRESMSNSTCPTIWADLRRESTVGYIWALSLLALKPYSSGPLYPPLPALLAPSCTFCLPPLAPTRSSLYTFLTTTSVPI